MHHYTHPLQTRMRSTGLVRESEKESETWDSGKKRMAMQGDTTLPDLDNGDGDNDGKGDENDDGECTKTCKSAASKTSFSENCQAPVTSHKF